jgi:hypothetical protein
MTKAVTVTAQNTTVTRVAYSASYMLSPTEGGQVSFPTWEELDQWFESFGCHCTSVVFH